ncbi:MAG: hypothetical protein JW940_34470 [Polyangiaceae bacterium]|nr:hypothetical protein [Polyangiaceae bacterium]
MTEALGNLRRATCRRTPRLVAAGCACVALELVVAQAGAQDRSLVGFNYGETETARTAAVGGAHRALGNSVGALFVNPSGMTSARVYHLAALAQIWPEVSRQSYGAGAVDSIVSSSHLAGGFGGTWNIQDRNGLDRQWTDLRAALAYPFSDEFSLGLAAHYLWLQQNGLGPFGASLASGGLRHEMIVRTVGVDAGITVRPSETFSIGLVANNFNDQSHGFLPLSIGGGVGIGTDTIAVEADAVADFTTWDRRTWRAMTGGTLLLADSYPISLGYRYDSGAKSHGISGGLGYAAKEFSAELACRRVLVGQDKMTAFVLELRYHVDALGTSGANDF